MESAQEKLDKLSTIEQSSKSCFLTYLQLIALPFFVYLYFVLGYFKIVSLSVHEHSLILMGFIFLTSLIFARHNAFFAKCLFKNGIGKFNVNLKSYIVKNLMSIGKYKKSNASFEQFSEIESKNIRNDNYASIGASVFPTMGILGTFISIALTMPDFASSTSGELDKEIGILLSGVGTAFYVSIYGILLSLWWMFYEKLGLSLYDKDLRRIKENTKVFFWTKEEIEQAYLQENLTHFKEIASMLQTISNEDFLKRLTNSVESKFATFNEMIKLESEAVHVSSNHFKQTMDGINQAHESQRNLAKVHQDILTTLQHFSKGLDNMQIKSLENYQYMQEGQKGMEESLISLNQTLQSNMKNLHEVHSTLPYELKQTQKDILHNFSKTLDDSIHRFWDESQLAAKERVDKLQKVNVDEFKKNVELTLDESEKVIQHMDELKSQE